MPASYTQHVEGWHFHHILIYNDRTDLTILIKKTVGYTTWVWDYSKKNKFFSPFSFKDITLQRINFFSKRNTERTCDDDFSVRLCGTCSRLAAFAMHIAATAFFRLSRLFFLMNRSFKRNWSDIIHFFGVFMHELFLCEEVRTVQIQSKVSLR